jgi:pyruvate dehydrogenase E1 component alpha subunit
MLGLVFSSTGYAPAGRPTQSPTTPQRAAVSTNIRMNVAGGTETVDFTGGKIRPQRDVVDDQMRPRPDIEWLQLRERLENEFGIDDSDLKKYDEIPEDAVLAAYEMMQLCRQFENACNQAYMQGNIRGFMHLDNGQESIPAMLADFINKDDIKYSYYREHTHALASGIDPGAIMAELFAKDTGTCRGTGGSMHIYDVDTHFQGGWALVSEQLPYAAGAARSILLDRELGQAKDGDDRMTVVFCGEGGSQNGRMAETLNAAAKENLPLLFVVIDNGRAINTFTQDVAKNSDVYLQGQHYGVPGIKVDGSDLVDVLKTGRAVSDYVRNTGPAILQIHTYRFMGHSPADPEHEPAVRWRSAGRAPSATRSSSSSRPISRPR